MINKTGILFISIVLLLSLTSLAQTDEKSQNSIEGIKQIGPGFQVFPDGKLGNTLYKDGKKIISRPDLVLHSVIDTLDGYIYYGINEADEPVLGYAGSEKTVFTALEGGYYELVAESGKRKIYRLTGEGAIQNLLPKSNTASGLVYNQTDMAAFFHITKGETIEVEEGQLKYQYTFRIHVVKDKDLKVIHLPETVSDFKPKLRLNWIDQNTLQFTLSNNQKETIIIE
jgi:hypothetical protein